ncbi:Zinc carboxypeptidase [Mesonia phycicola]|uniref:Zinc carboxypeptidase n=1 Tax=Mesonia phycicola TaxID=579105 RepID=A0A1M6BSJ3_9FLAO|nr:M14 family zinc carboxypeptidase [Mesonia phycicola]SHI51719.1 Zinc carboxypeptidase [Mesonia phycicola]
MEAKHLLEKYSEFKEVSITGRYLSYSSIVNYIENLPSYFIIQTEGKSVLGEKIYSIEFGNGPKKILMWSQMHGNESTTTKAVLDLLNFIAIDENDDFKNRTLEDCTIKIILVLNPDGLKNYTRVNANEVDLNRDATNQSQPESKILRKVFQEFKPHYCLNLHDQRTIFSAGSVNKPATVSFLAPAYNEAREVNTVREKAMQLIVGMSNYLQAVIPNQVGRYDDGFNINCVGDYFQAQNVPTILFEAGHYYEDYEREVTRKYIFLSLFSVVSQIISATYKDLDRKEYEKIPENDKLFNDIIIRNAEIEGEIKDVAIQYKEVLEEGKFYLMPIIEAIGDLNNRFGHKELNAENKVLRINSVKNLEIGIKIEKITLNNEIISIFLTNS